MGKLGTSTKLKHIGGGHWYDIRERCFVCKKRLLLRGFERRKDYFYEDNYYCQSCLMQAKAGFVFTPSPFKRYSQSYTGTCKVCGTGILNMFKYCLEHSPYKCLECGTQLYSDRYLVCADCNKNACFKCGIKIGQNFDFCRDCDPNYRRFRESLKVEKKVDNRFGRLGNLRYDLAYCQNMECANFKEPCVREKMVKMKMQAKGEKVMFMCSVECKDYIINKPENKFYVFKWWL